jgi:acyl-coenzyme A thioesterase PaaI-like protein
MNLKELKNLGDDFTRRARTEARRLTKNIPANIRHTARLRILGLLKIPVLFFVGPRVVEMTDQRCEVLIPLNRRTRNHLKSMYFGVLAAGADCAIGLLAWNLGDEYGKGRVGIIFKDFKADFLKRAEGDTAFICEEGDKIRAAIDQAISTGERQNIAIRAFATVPSESKSEPVAEFTLTLSLKYK